MLGTSGGLLQNPLEEGTVSSQGSCKWESQQRDPTHVGEPQGRRAETASPVALVTVCFGCKMTSGWFHTIAPSEILGHYWRKLKVGRRGCCWNMCSPQCVHVWARVCVLRSMCISMGRHVCMSMCISEPALHACETAASLCCGVSQHVQPNEPAQQS